MGGCLSQCYSSSSSAEGSGTTRHRKPSANVVSINGELRQYPLPATAAQVLQSETNPVSQQDDPSSFFLCNSDRLHFEDYIPSLGPDEELEPAQIYFVLPKSKLQYRLAASDMAALAVKASAALEQMNASNRRRKRRARISPVLVSDEDQRSSSSSGGYYDQVQIKGSSVNYYRSVGSSNPATRTSAGLGVSRSGSVRKLTRYSSRRAKLAARSFRIKLNTIYEGSVLHLN